MSGTSPTDVLAKAVILFGSPSSPDPDAYLAECRMMLSGCSPEVLDEVGLLMAQRHKFFPRPADFYDLTRDAAARVKGHKAVAAAQARMGQPAARSPATTPRPSDPPPPSPEAVKRARDLLQSFRADMAAKFPPPPPRPKTWKPVDRDSFATMQDASPTPFLHRALPPGIHRRDD